MEKGRACPTGKLLICSEQLELLTSSETAMIVKNPVESILALAASVFDAYSIVLFDAPKDGQGAPLLAAYSQEDHIDQSTVITPGKGLVGWILRNNSPLVIGSIDKSRAYLGYYKEDWEPTVCSFLGCPLPNGGIFCVDSRQRQAFSPEKQALIAVFADIISQTQAMELPREQGNSIYLQALDDLAKLRQNYPGWKNYLRQALPLMLKASGMQYAVFASRVEGSSQYIVEGESPNLLLKEQQPLELPVHNGIIGWVFRNEQTVYDDGHLGATPLFGKREGIPEFGSVLCLPVSMNKSTCGVLCLAAEEGKSLSEEMRSFVRLAADDLGRLLEVLSLRYRLRSMEKGQENGRR